MTYGFFGLLDTCFYGRPRCSLVIDQVHLTFTKDLHILLGGELFGACMPARRPGHEATCSDARIL